MSQREFAVIAGCGFKGLIQFEHGRGTMSVKLLCDVTKTLHIPTATFVEEAQIFVDTGKWPVASSPVLPKPEKQTWCSITIHRISDESPVPELDEEFA
jgi:transcriptional regulator with XRE-family HTH domain